MSTYFDSKYFGTLSWKSRQLLEELKQLLVKQIAIETEYKFPEFNVISYRKELVKQYSAIYLSYIEDSLKEAVKITEYSRNTKFFTQLFTAIATFWPEIRDALAVNYYAGALKEMEKWIGDMRDFIHGVNIARVNLGVDPYHGSKEKKAKFWKTYIWPNDTIYDKTVQARLDAWGQEAPYWKLIEEGNMGADLAYPHFPATNFFSNAIEKIEGELDMWVAEAKGNIEGPGTADKEAEQRIMTIVEQAQKRLLNNPDSYVPGEVLAQFDKISTQRKYEIYVTQKRGQVGVRVIR